MSDQQTPAESSPAEVTDVFNGQNPSLAEYSNYRKSGELPERFKPVGTVESTTTDAPEETADATEGKEPETAPESEPDEAQEHPQKGSAAEKRIKQLLAQKKDLERQLAATAKTDVKPESSTVQPSQPPQNYQDYRKEFKPSLWIGEYAKANPDASYEDANAAMADHLYDVRKHFDQIEQRVRAEAQALNAKVEEAKERYEDFDEIKETFLGKVLGDKGPMIPVSVLAILNDSDVLADLIYTIGSDEKATADFVRMAQSNPTKAIRHIARLEVGIQEELAKAGKEASGTESGKAPEVKRTQAPKPPSPVTGGSSRAFDVSDESLSADDWFRKRNQQLSKKG